MTTKWDQNAKFHRSAASTKTIRSITITFLVSTPNSKKYSRLFCCSKIYSLKDIWIFRHSNKKIITLELQQIMHIPSSMQLISRIIIEDSSALYTKRQRY